MTKKKAQVALAIAKQLAKDAQCATDFHNAFFGIGGKFGKLFPTEAERTAFMKSPEYRQIFRMRAEMRKAEKVVL